MRDALTKVRPGVARNTMVPAQACVLISASGAGLTFTTCDLEQRISTTVEQADVIVEGVAAVPHERLSQLVNVAKPGAIDCVLDGHELTVTANGGAMVAVLNTIDAEQFPRWTNATGEPVDIGADWLAITNVMHARERKDAAKPRMMHVSVGGGWAWATDTYRLARQPVAVSPDANLMLPGSLIESVAKAVGSAVGLTLTWDGARFDLEHEGTIWSGILFGEEIAAWSMVVTMYDRPRTSSVSVDRQAFIDAITAIGAIGTEQREAKDGHKYTSAIVHLATADSGLVVDGKHSEFGHVTIDLAADVVGAVDARFNGAYLLDALNACESDTIVLDFDKDAAAFKPVGIIDDELEMLIMPVK